MAQAAESTQPEEIKNTPKKPIKERIDDRNSEELVIGFSGAIGAGVNEIKQLFTEELRNLSYEINDIKLSETIKQQATDLLKNKNIDFDDQDLKTARGLARYTSLQDAGNKIREAYTNDILAQLAVSQIANSPQRVKAEAQGLSSKPSRTVHILDQLKHPDEVTLLRAVYGDNFFLVGVLSGEEKRKSRLVHETSCKSAEVGQIIDRDRRESILHGQQLDKTLKLSDFFIRNSSGNAHQAKVQISRFLRLAHGATDVTPSVEEFGMYVAYSSALASACMSRQVGAAILTEDGTVLATGCNDVPKAGGGLYSRLDEPDYRCVMKIGGICHNDHEKTRIQNEIAKIITDNGIPEDKATSIAESIRRDSRIGDLIEFSRAVHAEMDALVSVARRGSGSVSGAALYSTTYPCHNCARHILAAGISRVYFIEPYEKSLAVHLHDDAIVHDIEPDEAYEDKVPFIHFEGISPSRYQALFAFPSSRKKDGKKIDFVAKMSKKKVTQVLDGYRDIEKQVVKHLKDIEVLNPDLK